MSTIGYYICVPFAWLVRLFYNLTGSYGVALILFTLVIKLIMLPFQMKSKKSMMRMSRVSGQMQDIQKRYANNQVKLQEEELKEAGWYTPEEIPPAYEENPLDLTHYMIELFRAHKAPVQR